VELNSFNMATFVECPEYANCGYVKWRKERPDLHMPPLPESGDCGKLITACGRLNPAVPFAVETYGPLTREEIDASFPELPNKNGRPKRRLIGGGE